MTIYDLKNIKGYDKAIDKLAQFLFDNSGQLFKECTTSKDEIEEAYYIAATISNDLHVRFVKKLHKFMRNILKKGDSKNNGR